MSESGKKQRMFGADVIRTVAVLSVLSLHALLNTGYYYRPVAGLSMYCQTVLRFAATVCVPLFIMLTGYLQVGAKPTKKYFSGIFSTLCIYLFWSVITAAVRLMYFRDAPWGETTPFTAVDYIKNFFNYPTIGYAWYVEMFIGLFFLSPFLNRVTDGQTRKEANVFMLVLIALFPLTAFVNAAAGHKLFPDYWNAATYAYPFVYYFAGSYIRKYQPKINKPLLASAFAVMAAVFAFASARLTTKSFNDVNLGRSGDIPAFLLSVTAFLFLYDLKTENRALQRVFKYTSVTAFDVYLVSYVTDRFVWKLNLLAPLHIKIKPVFFPLIIPIIYLLCFAAGFGRYSLAGALKKLPRRRGDNPGG
jgi:surface polysaccharide O-acyltransferase-like enzyme